MTVSSSTNRDDYAGNGSTTSFSVSFRFLENSHIKATLRDALSTETLQVETTDYTLTGAGGAGGGTLVMIVAPPSGTTLTIQRDVPATQETDYVENDEFPAEAHEDALDKLTMLVQQQGEDSTRHIGFSDTVSDATGAAVELSQDATQRADKFLGFDSAGNIVTKTASSVGLVDQAQQDKRYGTTFATEAAMVAGVSLDGVVVEIVAGMQLRVVSEGVSIYEVVSSDAGSDTALANGLFARQMTYNIGAIQGMVSGKEKFAARLALANRNKEKVVWVGDSITEQGKTGIGNNIGFTTFLEALYPAATYVNEGVGGDTTADIIARTASITANDGDLYVVAIGINDIRENTAPGALSVTEYIANITTINTALAAGGKDVMYIGIFPSFWEDQFSALFRAETDSRMSQYNNALRDFCRTNSLPFSDPNPAIRTVVDFGNVQTLIPDGVHPDYSGTAGKQLYADSILVDNPRREDYSANVYADGKVFFKFRFGDNEQTDGLMGIRNIAITGATFDEGFGETANLSFPYADNMYGAFDAGYSGFFNKANDYPLYTTLGVDQWPDSLVVTGSVSASVGNRGPRVFETWFSTDPNSVTDIEHSSWVLFEKSTDDIGVCVNLLPKGKTRAFYQLRLTSGTTVNMKRIGVRYPVNVKTQNVVSSSEQRWDLIFGAGASVAGDALVMTVPNGAVMWEADGEENDVILESFTATLADFSIYRSTDPNCLSSVTHESWQQVLDATADGTFTIPRMVPGAIQADSVAADVATIVTDYNSLLAKLRTAQIIQT